MPQNEKIYAAYELACLMDSNRLCSDLVSSLVRLICVVNSHKDIYDKSQVARKAVEDLAIELGISICRIEEKQRAHICKWLETESTIIFNENTEPYNSMKIQ